MRVETIKLTPAKCISSRDKLFVSKVQCYRGVVMSELTVFIQDASGKETGTYRCLAADAPNWLRKAIGLEAA